ncbi:uncharacterized protein LOC136033670 [Artemia franciscana]|uniref:uncharacterized protein LOC136033670 n=1 Tax=Artemia franciscana TaxID=6661 RepID=UPI0032DA6DEC
MPLIPKMGANFRVWTILCQVNILKRKSQTAIIFIFICISSAIFVAYMNTFRKNMFLMSLPEHYNPIEPTEISDYEDIRNIFLSTRKDLCPVQEIWGGMYSVSNFIEQGLTKKMVKKDGNYTVCFAETVAPPKTGCLVYSFGIRFEWEFEEKAEEFGCDVFAFDPSMGVASHRHSLKIFFYNQGLSNFDGVIQKGHQYWKMATFSSLLKQNNHTHSTIHILKIDVEGSEHEAIPDMIRSGNLNNVCQILLEIHNFAGLTLEKYYDLYWLLYKQEFVSVAVEEWNHADCSKKKKIGGHEIYCFVFTFINLRFL